MVFWTKSGDRLNGGVGLAVAGLAERDKVRQFVRGPEVLEEPERANVMHVDALFAAMLTDAAVALSRLAALGEPVRAAVVAWPTLELRMERADPSPIATFAGAELAAAPSLTTRRSRERRTASQTNDAGRRDLSRGHGGILAGART
jgi:hypothetical protein